MPCTESLSNLPSSVLLAPHLSTSSMTNRQSNVVAFWVKRSTFRGIWKISLTKHLTPLSKEREKWLCLIVMTWKGELLIVRQCCKLPSTNRTAYHVSRSSDISRSREPMQAWVGSLWISRGIQTGDFHSNLYCPLGCETAPRGDMKNCFAARLCFEGK